VTQTLHASPGSWRRTRLRDCGRTQLGVASSIVVVAVVGKVVGVVVVGGTCGSEIIVGAFVAIVVVVSVQLTIVIVVVVVVPVHMDDGSELDMDCRGRCCRLRSG
jgi:hypothetical protein